MKKTASIAVGIFVTLIIHAQQWTGAVSSDWNNPANWSFAPQNGNDLLIDFTAYTGAMVQPEISVQSAFSPGEITLQDGAVLLVSADLTTTGNVNVTGVGSSLSLQNGSFILNGQGAAGQLIISDGAHLGQTGGDLTVADAIIVETGGEAELSGGILAAGGITVRDGNTTGSSRLLQNGTDVTIDGAIVFTNLLGNYFPSYEKAEGNLSVTGGIMWSATAPGSGKGTFRLSGGLASVSGLILNNNFSTIDMSIQVTGEAEFRNSATEIQLTPGDSVLLENGAQWRDMGSTIWKNDGVVYSHDGVFHAGTMTLLAGSGHYEYCNLWISAGKQIDHLSPQNLYVNGFISCKGVFEHHTNKLVLKSDLYQLITTSNTGITFYDLEINNYREDDEFLFDDYGVFFNYDVTITHNLSLVDGMVAFGPAGTLKIADDATVTGGSDSTFIQGYMEKSGNEAFVFPLGKRDLSGSSLSVSRRYRPLTISAPQSASTVVRAGYRYEAYETTSPVNLPLENASQIEYWDLSRTGSSDLFNVSLGWNKASESGLTDCVFTTMARHTPGGWMNVPSSVSGLCEDGNSGSLTSSSVLPEIGPVSIGFLERVYQDFVTLCTQDSITINNNTYTESGVYVDEMQGQNGNDSIVITVLTVLDPFYASLSDNGNFIIAGAAGATHFQWFNCTTNEIVQDGPSSYFYPEETGSYGVIVSRENCEDTDTSYCMFIEIEESGAGIGEQVLSEVLLYPNPVLSNTVLSIQSDFTFDEAEILTIDGRIIFKILLTDNLSGDQSFILPQLTGGTYLLKGKLDQKEVICRRFSVAE